MLRTYKKSISGFLAILAISTNTALAGAAEPVEAIAPMPSLTSLAGPYVRAEFGGVLPHYTNAFWLPPGAADPQVFFDLSGDLALSGGLAVGYDYANGIRWDVSLSRIGAHDATGPWSHTDPDTAGPHADISEASVSTTVGLINVYYSPFTRNGNNQRFQPFVTAGLGFAENTLSDWTRDNAGERTFEGSSSTEFAWAVGAGASWGIGSYHNSPVSLDVTYRYMDLGVVKGGSTPISSGGEPVQGLTFDHNVHSISVGVRIPL